MKNLKQYKEEIASELGVQIGDRNENRNKSCAYFGQVGGEMVRRALADSFGPASHAAQPNNNYYQPQH